MGVELDNLHNHTHGGKMQRFTSYSGWNI